MVLGCVSLIVIDTLIYGFITWLPTFFAKAGLSVATSFGVKGAGKAGTTGALATAMNAILHALRPAGVAQLDMPASARRVWQALRAAEARG